MHGAAADAERPLVNVEEGADAVAGAVEEVHAILPERAARERLEHDPGRARGEDCSGEGDVPLEDPRVRPHGVLGRGLGAEMQGPGGVSRAIDVLPAGIAQVDCIELDGLAVAVLGVVVDHRSVGAGGADGGK